MPKQRGRACGACHQLKIKCELGAVVDAEPPCQRCIRLGKDCSLSSPRRQKDRVAELEAKVEALTRLLEARGISDDTNASSETTQSSASDIAKGEDEFTYGSKKRRLSDNRKPVVELDTKIQEDSSSSGVQHLDDIVPRDQQQLCLDAYRRDHFPRFPAIPVPQGMDLDELRTRHPVLLHAIVFAASPGKSTLEMKQHVTEALLKLLSSKSLSEGLQSLELVQALHATALYYHIALKGHQHIVAFQLAHLARSMCTDLGFDGSESFATLIYSPSAHVLASSLEARRAWLTDYFISSGIAFMTRKPVHHQWTPYHEECLRMLEGTGDMNDILFCQHIRGDRLCTPSADILYHLNTASDLATYTLCSKAAVKRLAAEAKHFKLQIPTEVRCKSLMLYEHMAGILMHEPILHTATNAQSFSLPYIVEKLSVSDFPRPVMTDAHIVSLRSLVQYSHQFLDQIFDLQPLDLIALPMILGHPRVLHALLMLIKTYIALTAPGNTYGSRISVEEVRLDTYLDASLAMSSRVAQIDSSAMSTLILAYAGRMKQWAVEYRNSMDPVATQNDDYQSSTAYMAASDAENEMFGLYDDDWLQPLDGGSWLSDFFDPGLVDFATA